MNTKVLGRTASKDEEVLGSYAPTKEPHVVQLSPEEVPSGFIARGEYTGIAKLLDVEG